MNRFFNSDSPFMQGLSWIVDLVILNLLTLLLSLPVITFGAAFSALYQSLERLGRDEGNIYSGYFHAFRLHFKRSTLIWIILLAALAAIVISISFYWNADLKGFTVLAIAALIVWLLTYVWAFPVLVKTDGSIAVLLRKSFFYGLRYLPITIALIVIHLLPIILMLYPEVWVKMSFAMILIWFSLVAEITRRIAAKVTKDYTQENSTKA